MHSTHLYDGRFPFMKDRDPSQSTASQQSKAKKPKLSVAKKGKRKSNQPKKHDFIDSDDDFVNPKPGPSSCVSQSLGKETKLTDQEIKRKKIREKVAKSRAKKSAEERKLRNSIEAERQKTKRAAETKEEHQERKKIDAERHANKRAAESTEERQERNQLDAARHANKRAVESTEQHQERNQLDAGRHAQKRAAESTEVHQERNRLDAARHAAVRAAETTEEHQLRNRVDAQRHAARRANLTEEQQLEERSAAREGMKASRKYTTAGFKDATLSQEILQGTFQVFKLEATVDTIGRGVQICCFKASDWSVLTFLAFSLVETAELNISNNRANEC